MAGRSTLDPDNFPRRQPGSTPPGHDTRSLGPSDSSDSGSDMAGPGLLDDDLLNLDRGTNDDTEAGRQDVGDTGPSVGDLGMDADTDPYGTGAHLTAGKDPNVRVNGGLDTHRIGGPSQAGLRRRREQEDEDQFRLPEEESEKKGGQ